MNNRYQREQSIITLIAKQTTLRLFELRKKNGPLRDYADEELALRSAIKKQLLQL